MAKFKINYDSFGICFLIFVRKHIYSKTGGSKGAQGGRGPLQNLKW